MPRRVGRPLPKDGLSTVDIVDRYTRKQETVRVIAVALGCSIWSVHRHLWIGRVQLRKSRIQPKNMPKPEPSRWR